MLCQLDNTTVGQAAAQIKDLSILIGQAAAVLSIMLFLLFYVNNHFAFSCRMFDSFYELNICHSITKIDYFIPISYIGI